jgi:hypothetical protein
MSKARGCNYGSQKGRALVSQNKASIVVKMNITSSRAIWRGVAALILFGSAHSQAQAPVSLNAFQALQPGLWEFKSAQDSTANRSICLRDVKAMLQLKHFGQACTQFVITNEAKIATVHYQCNATSHGQTNVRVETPRLVQLQSQGLVNRAPFSFSAEGRRIGDCIAAR